MKKRSLSVVAGTVAMAAALAVNLALSWRDVSGPGVLVLTYHRVADDAGVADKYTMPVATFSRQLDALRQDGFTFIVPGDLAGGGSRLAKGPQPVLVTFDDGTQDHYRNVLPLLEKRGITGLFFVTAGRVGKPGYLTGAELREMADRGQVIGSHSNTHPVLDELEGEQLRNELVVSKAALEAFTGRPVEMFAPPGGWFNAETVAAARTAGYRAFFSCDFGLNRGGEEFVSPRANASGTLSPAAFRRLTGARGLLRERFLQRLRFLVRDVLGTTRSLALARRLGLSPP